MEIILIGKLVARSPCSFNYLIENIIQPGNPVVVAGLWPARGRSLEDSDVLYVHKKPTGWRCCFAEVVLLQTYFPYDVHYTRCRQNKSKKVT